MAKKTKKSGLISTNQIVAENRRARFDYQLEDTFEAGIVLTGTEVKSLRLGQCSINEAYVGPQGNEIVIHNMHIPEYAQAGSHLQHDPKRPRVLLLKRREINKLIGAVSREGYTIVATKIYFDKRGMAKVGVALGKGKKQYDKRETEKSRDWNKQKGRIMREKG